jgi:hypothetical protein
MDSTSGPSKSSLSLLPPSPALLPVGDTRRRLLIVYIHGFLGDETSFKSFPKHVHELLNSLLSHTHVVHSKIYPRYKTRRSINIVAEEFSTWHVFPKFETPD